MVNAVFVYADGQVGPRELPAEPPVWRDPVRRPFAGAFAPDPGPLEPSFDIREYELRGRMFDGRPVYCAPGYDVREAYADGYAYPYERASMDRAHRTEVRELVRRDHPGFVSLDEWIGDSPLHPLLKGAPLIGRAYRLLVAVKS